MLAVDLKGLFPVELLSFEDSGQIGIHTNCGTHSLIMYQMERMTITKLGDYLEEMLCIPVDVVSMQALHPMMLDDVLRGLVAL